MKSLRIFFSLHIAESTQMHCDEKTSTDMDDTAVQSGMEDRERKTTALDDIHVDVPRDTSTRFQSESFVI